MNIIKEIPPKQPKNNFVAVDVEIFGLNPKQLHRPTSGVFACLSIAVDPETVYLIENVQDVPYALGAIENCVWVIHHAKFDITHLRRWAEIPPRKKLWDTMLIERILWGGYYDFFALEHLARRYLDIKMDKSMQKEFEHATQLTDEMIHYAVMDASITLKICEAQKAIVRKEDMQIWKEVDRPALWAYLDFQGFPINVDAWKQLADLNEQRAKSLDSNFPFNSRSPAQVKAYLIENGFKRLPDTQEKTLSEFIRKFPEEPASEVATRVLECRKYAKRASTYGMNFIKHYLEKDGDVDVIHCDYHIIGAETGRTASSAPNMQNIVARDTNEFRKCFVARPGNVMLVADYSQQEPAISAFLAEDEKMIEIINSGKDIYIEVAREVFGEEIGAKDPRRKIMKSLVLGTNYGLSPKGLAIREDMSVEDAEKLISKYFWIFPGIAKWSNHQIKHKDWVETVVGRRIWLNPYSGQCERNALNSPIQGSAADITKMAVARLYENWNFDYPFAVVATIHDEIVLDVPEGIADEVAKFVEETMASVAEGVCNGITFRAEIIKGVSWGDKT